MGNSGDLLAAQARLLALRRAFSAAAEPAARPQAAWPVVDWQPRAKTDSAEPIPHPAAIRLHPDIGLAILRHGHSAAGRLWLLLRHLDTAGRGWLTLTDVRRQMTEKRSPWRVCGPRQLRNVLRAGDGLFWQRHADRLWLRSTVKVAAQLGVARLQGRPVALKPDVLVGSIGTVRAHLYAAFHSGRSERPIARQTLQALSGACHNTQRHYEQRVGVGIRPNYALGSRLAAVDGHDNAWHHGRAAFTWHDAHGRHGAPHARYAARQLPNSFDRIHDCQSRASRRRLNRALRALSHLGTTGNGLRAASRRYWPDGQAAARATAAAGTEATDMLWQDQSTGVWHSHRRAA